METPPKRAVVSRGSAILVIHVATSSFCRLVANPVGLAMSSDSVSFRVALTRIGSEKGSPSLRQNAAKVASRA